MVYKPHLLLLLLLDQKVNITNYTHRDGRERAHSNITYGVGIFILQTARLKNVMPGYKMSTCQLSGCYTKKYIKNHNVCKNYFYHSSVIIISVLLGNFDNTK